MENTTQTETPKVHIPRLLIVSIIILLGVSGVVIYLKNPLPQKWGKVGLVMRAYNNFSTVPGRTIYELQIYTDNKLCDPHSIKESHTLSTNKAVVTLDTVTPSPSFSCFPDSSPISVDHRIELGEVGNAPLELHLFNDGEEGVYLANPKDGKISLQELKSSTSSTVALAETDIPPMKVISVKFPQKNYREVADSTGIANAEAKSLFTFRYDNNDQTLPKLITENVNKDFKAGFAYIVGYCDCVAEDVAEQLEVGIAPEVLTSITLEEHSLNGSVRKVSLTK